MAKGKVSKPSTARKGKGRQTRDATSRRLVEPRQRDYSNSSYGFRGSQWHRRRAFFQARPEQDTPARIFQRFEAILDQIEQARQTDRDAFVASQAAVTTRLAQLEQDAHARTAQQLDAINANQTAIMARLKPD
ncbi:hypothetical protein CLAFUW4_08057 [Fulvia fulva]|uniref:Uncharacterized protein n=1 Tax=Passalora fulva TaxID=5499 RepID=A0A9Q8LDC3_PASFU|nr:uncharacterized protein CLAFUR5_08175 [Fulvia fulva]KAK4628769.1 hypothetical protein CLAFUR4_08062 [Fulvia fulva]KAK4629996.1 hypothetical protein CLAFUR0_08057 [Fulvia fulva]UJO15333.1 hypothetical protein CLAFUR5_08175 [Fulvia fulva]WPV12880.1 hypothetical protein CLAFUW4_08057 [Fulvia fulva]WPV27022.1 hypothetical protein CLAFUW7_08057 [Fulvia fulva]